MARANRHTLPDMSGILHIDAVKKEFLLKFVHDRRRWMDWLFEAKKRFSLSVLNYMVISNHYLCEASHK